MRTRSSSTRRTRPHGARAYILILVLMAMAVASAVVVGQLGTVQSEAVASVRGEEELQARAMAMGCLDMLQAYVNTYMDPEDPRFDDFDGVLDPDGNPTSGDEFMPPMGVNAPVHVPPAPPGEESPARRWRYFPIPASGGSLPGACLLRIEDNSDDGLMEVATPIGATGPGEGPSPPNDGADNPMRDRDRTIFLSAIGLYPVLSTTEQSAAWTKAHARVTLRRLYGVQNKPQSIPAVRACGDVSIGNNVTMSGTGGIISSQDITVGGGNSCVCGSFVGATAPTSVTACAGCTEQPSTSAGSPPTCVPPGVNGPHSYLAISGFGDPNNPGGVNLGNDDTCKVFVDQKGYAFIWDVTDDNPYQTLTSDYDLAVTVPSGTGHPHNCTDYKGRDNYTGIGGDLGEPEVHRPCTWDFGSGLADAGVEGGGPDLDVDSSDGDSDGTDVDPTVTRPVVTCTDTQTLCWKPLAILNDRDDTPGFRDGTPSNGFEWESNENSSDLIFYKNTRIPYVKNTNRKLATPGNNFCGAETGVCEDCPSGTADRTSAHWMFECSGGAVGRECGDIHAHGKHTNRHFPAPSIFVVETAPGKKLKIKQSNTDTEPLWATFLTNSVPVIEADAGFCSAMMPNGCMDPDGATGIGTGMTARRNIGCTESQAPTPPLAPSPYPPGYRYPIVLRATGAPDLTPDEVARPDDVVCNLRKANTYVGTVECKAFDVLDSPCLVGELHAYGRVDPSAVGCDDNGLPSCTDVAPEGATGVGVCFNSNLLGPAPKQGAIVSNGSVCGKTGDFVTADIYSQGNISFKNNTTINGRLNSHGAVSFANNATFTSSSNTYATSGNQGMISFMEASW